MSKRTKVLAVLTAFYAPGLLMLGGAFALGYTLEEARGVIAAGGGVAGTVAGMMALVAIIIDVEQGR